MLVLQPSQILDPFSDRYWVVAIAIGTLFNVMLFMLMPSMAKKDANQEEPVIVLEFMEWREPTLPAKKRPLPKPKPKELKKPKPIPPKKPPIKPAKIEKPKPIVEKILTEELLPQTQDVIAKEEVPVEEPVVVEPPQLEPELDAKDEPVIEAKPVPVPIFKLTHLPRFAHKVIPEYPLAMRNISQQATVKLELLIDRNGKVREVRVKQSAGEVFDQAAIVAMKASTFIPGNIEGKPVAVLLRIPVKFSLR